MIDWHPFHQYGSTSTYSGPVMRSNLALHDGALFRPHRLEHAQAALRDTDHDHQGEDVEHALHWLHLDEAEFHRVFGEAAELSQLRDRVPGNVERWTFIDQAFEYLRRSEEAEGYEQFVMLTAVVDCLFSRGKAGAGDFSNFLGRGARMCRLDDSEPPPRRKKRVAALYDTRSRYVHGDLKRDAVLGVGELNAMNSNARLVLRRVLRWLAALRAEGGPGPMPGKEELLQYLDATEASEALSSLVRDYPCLQASPPDFTLI